MTPLQEKALHLLQTTQLFDQQIADQLGCSRWSVSNTARRYLDPNVRAARTFSNHSVSNTGEKHYAYSGGVDALGYARVAKPAWFIGHSSSSQLREHVLIACQAQGIVELPAGCVVHHIDENKLNNEPLNLIIVSRGVHMKIHAQIRATAPTPPCMTYEHPLSCECHDCEGGWTRYVPGMND